MSCINETGPKPASSLAAAREKFLTSTVPNL